MLFSDSEIKEITSSVRVYFQSNGLSISDEAVADIFADALESASSHPPSTAQFGSELHFARETFEVIKFVVECGIVYFHGKEAWIAYFGGTRGSAAKSPEFEARLGEYTDMLKAKAASSETEEREELLRSAAALESLLRLPR